MTIMKQIKIATWNIGSLYDGTASRSSTLYTVLRDYSPDILALQELPHQNSLMEEIKEILGAYGYIHITCSRSHVANMDMDICIYSKFPIILRDSLQLNALSVTSYIRNGKEEHLHRKSFMSCEITIDQEKYCLITGHGYPVHRYGIPIEIFSPSFMQLDEWISQTVKNYTPENIILACDFNIPNPLFYMEELKKDYLDPLIFLGTRPSGRKTDSIIVHKERKIYELVNIQTGFDHNFVMLTL